jgi:hypothetical protein
MATVTTAEMQTKVKDLLKSLGTGPNKIADSLKEMKIKGYRSESDQCPITKLIRKQFKNLKGICSTSDAIEFTLRGEDCVVQIPKAVGKFMDKFDNGDYPELAFKEAGV